MEPDTPAAGRKLGDVPWPPASTPVSVLRGRRLRAPRPDSDLAPGDRVSLLIPAPQNPPPQHPDGTSHEQPASREGTST
ncbi:MAG: TrkA C-terminal domain-containing protein [Streptosporangiaceae bacterium]